ncbi:hypothetical protein CBM2637_B110330 [Cupriavidus taiwanensis]|nr:hypothetical protein CBM2637_B110330 [Cupriavidus taiwanensis]
MRPINLIDAYLPMSLKKYISTAKRLSIKPEDLRPD